MCLAASNELKVSTDFPGGSAQVVEINQESRTVQIKPASHPNRGWECWWYFKLTGIKSGEVIHLEVSGMNFALPDNAHYSEDGEKWMQTSAGERASGSVAFHQRVKKGTAWFAWGPPFQLADAKKLVDDSAKQKSLVTKFALGHSGEGREVPAMRVTEKSKGGLARPVIWVQARQHAWESGSSWVCKGFTEWLLSKDSRAAALRQQAEVYIVPIMDLDNVERGAGGKNQTPHDHNRDWSDEPVWPEVRSAQTLIKTFAAQGRFEMFIDLHNPAPNDRQPMFFLVPKPELTEVTQQRLDTFLGLAHQEMTGPLKLSEKVTYTDAKYDANWDKISKVWVQRNGGPGVVAVTLETSWNTPHSTMAGYKQVGRELGLSVAAYFKTLIR